jgi:predicted DNA-binding protein
MTATVRLDDNIEEKLNKLSLTLHKKKSDVFIEAISFYFLNIENSKKNRILNAVNKVKDSDKKEYNSFEGTISDGI